MARRGEDQRAIPNTLDCGDAAAWALWRLSIVLKEIGNNAQKGASAHSNDEDDTDKEVTDGKGV